MMGKYMVEKWERKGGWNDFCIVVRGSSEEAKGMRNGLMLVTCLPPKPWVFSEPGCCLVTCLGLWPHHSLCDVHEFSDS